MITLQTEFEEFTTEYGGETHAWVAPGFDTQIEYANGGQYRLYKEDGTPNPFPVKSSTDWRRYGNNGFHIADKETHFLTWEFDYGHSGNQISDEQRELLLEKLSPYCDLTMSTGGEGIHGRIRLDRPIPCSNRQEYARQCKAGVLALCNKTGLDFYDWVEKFGSILWLASIDGNEQSFTSDNEFQGQLPLSTAELLAELNNVPEPEAVASRATVELSGEHERILDAYKGPMNPSYHKDGTPCINVHSVLLKRACDQLGIEFATDSEGKHLDTPNCYMTPQDDGSFIVTSYRGSETGPGWFNRQSDGKPCFILNKPRDDWRTRFPEFFTHPAEKPEQRYNVLSWNEFKSENYKREFIIDRCVVEHQPLVVGGAMKTLKTTLLMEAGISLATGTPFLGEFETKKRRVLFMSGESGGWALQETALRQCEAKGVQPEDGYFAITEDLPRFANEKDLVDLENLLRELKTEVLMIDPAYLCTGGADSGILNSMGPLLGRIGDVCRRLKITLFIAHHNTKASALADRAPTMADLTGAGFAEWGRQFLLLSRKNEFQRGTGHHELWFAVDGSAGPSMLKHLTIDEGPPPAEGQARKWEVQVRDAADIKAEQTVLKEMLVRAQKIDRIREALAEGPMQCTHIRKAIGSKLDTQFLDTLVEDEVLVKVKIPVGKRGHVGSAYDLPRRAK